MIKKNYAFDLRPNKSLLDPSFEGYKLSLEPIPIYRKSLESGVRRAQLDDDQFSFYHVKNFSLHNHLHVNHKKSNCLYYVDEQFKVHKIVFSPLNREIFTEEVFDFGHIQVQRVGSFNVSIAFPSSEIAAICPGNGTLYLIEIKEIDGREKWRFLSQETLIRENKPCQLLDAKVLTSGSDIFFHIVLLQIEEKKTIENKVGKNGIFQTLFKWKCFHSNSSRENFWEEKFSKNFIVDGNIDYLVLENNCQCLHIVCDKHPKCIEPFENSIDYEENTQNLAEPEAENKTYFWKQTEKELTVWLPVKEENLKKDDFKISFADLAMEVKVKSDVVLSGNFFHRIDSDLSVWILEKNKLEIQLTKHESGLMWKTLFVDDDRGEEIMDPSLVEFIHDQFSHLCANEITGLDERDGNLPPFNTQQLEECDAPNSDTTSLIRLDGLHHKITHEVNLSGSQWLFKVHCDPDQTPAICCRHDVDACVWQFKDLGENDKSWPHEHKGTFNAFGYVQASKTLKKFLVGSPNLSYAAICELSHHIYIYRQPMHLSSELKNRNTGKKVKTISKQQLINLETNEEILGVHATDFNLFILLENSIHVMIINE